MAPLNRMPHATRETRRSKPFLFAVAAALALAAVSLVSCRAGHPRKVIFIGVDGMDWEMVDSLRARGEMPNLDGLIKRGCSTRIETNEWGRGSAVYWTDVATGQLSARHGIEDFVVHTPGSDKIVPNTSNRRRTKAFWNILSEKDIPVGVVGWYITWPVERVKGFMVSSYLGVRQEGRQPIWKGSFYSDAPEMVYPPSLEAETKAASLDAEKEYQKDIPRIIARRGPKWRRPIVAQAEWAFMTDAIYDKIGVALYRTQKPRFFAVYLSGIDVVGHRFTADRAKKAAKLKLWHGDVQANYYRAIDDLLKPLLDMADEDTTVVVCSDHGLMRHEHTKNGVFVIAGRGIKAGARLEKPIGLVDICPTLLYLQGLPAAEDMDGRVFLDVLTPDYVRAHRVKTIATYGPRRDASDKPIETNLDEAIIKRLKTLGYLK